MDGRVVVLCVFFFQAEDGIRDGRVTGVQTCALPISGAPIPGATVTVTLTSQNIATKTTTDIKGEYSLPSLNVGTYEIGRASCRERAKISVDAVSLKRREVPK